MKRKAYDLVDIVLDNKLSIVKEAEKLVDKILLREQNEGEITLDTFKDYIDDLKKKGFDDETKLQGMLDRAKELAKEQGKENDKQVILGIFQKFFMGK